MEAEKNAQIEELRIFAQVTEVQTRERFDNYNTHLERLKAELSDTRNHLSFAKEEGGQLLLANGQLENELRQCQQHLERLESQLNFLEKQKENELEELKQRLQTNFDIASENQRNKHRSELDNLATNLAQLRSELELKNIQNRELAEKNEELQLAVDELEVSTLKI